MEARQPSHPASWLFVTGNRHFYKFIIITRILRRTHDETIRWGGDLRGALEHGNYQDQEVMGIEVHAKEAARFEAGWALFQFDCKKTGKQGTLSKSYRP